MPGAAGGDYPRATALLNSIPLTGVTCGAPIC